MHRGPVQEACVDNAASGESDPCSLDFAFILGLPCVTNDAIADLSLEKYHLRHSRSTEQILLSGTAKRTTYTIARICPPQLEHRLGKKRTNCGEKTLQSTRTLADASRCSPVICFIDSEKDSSHSFFHTGFSRHSCPPEYTL